MATCQHILNLLDRFLPFQCVAAKDNTGLLIGDPAWPVTHILVAVDLTEAVIAEAITQECDMILTHHHIMGKGIKRVTPQTFEGRAILSLIQHHISFCACHNNLDFLNGGTADALMLAAGCQNSIPLYNGYAALATTPQETLATSIPVPQGEHTVSGLTAGFGRIGDLAEPCTLRQLIQRLQKVLTGPVHIVGEDTRMIRKAACQVGAGKHADMDRTKALGADVLITGDVCHDDRLYAAELGICLLDFCHHEAELPGVLMMAKNLRDALEQDGCGVSIHLSQAAAPVRHETMSPELDLSWFGL